MKNINLNINELNLENIVQWPKPAKLGLIIFMVIILVALGYWLIAKSNFDEYTSLQTKERSLRDEFERKQHEASNLAAYRNQLTLMEQRFGDMLRQLPSANEMPSLLEDISKTGVASGLTFDLFAPMPEIPHDFYVELPIKIEVLGNYHQLAIFLSRVARINRIVTFHDFTVERADTKELEKPSDQLRMKLTAKIYRYRTR